MANNYKSSPANLGGQFPPIRGGQYDRFFQPKVFLYNIPNKY